MSDELEHLRWTRLQIEPVLKPRKPPPSPRPRSNRAEHAQKLDTESSSVFDRAGKNRQRQGIAPDRLLVLRMRFLDATQRDLLDKLGLRILDEREERTPLESPVFEVQVEFPSDVAVEALRQWHSLSEFNPSWVRTGRFMRHAASYNSRIATLRTAPVNLIEVAFLFHSRFAIQR